MRREVYDMEAPGQALRAIADGLLEASRQSVAATVRSGVQVDDVEIAQVERQVELLEAMAEKRRARLAALRKAADLRARPTPAYVQPYNRTGSA